MTGVEVAPEYVITPGVRAGRLLRLRPWLIDRPRRRFAPADPDVQERLDAVVQSFAAGYNAVLAPDGGRDIAALPAALRGFAVEGAAMSCVLTDLLSFSGGSRLTRLGEAYGERYTHLIHVGAGWAFARLRRPPWRGIRFGEPVVRWLAWDGWGFHQAFFGARKVFGAQWVERAARGEARPVRDQGAGRALWFYAGADPGRISAIIGRFPEHRRGDLWAGIGLAASYTGAQSADVARELVRDAGRYRPQLGQGAAFAAKARTLAGEVPPSSAAAIGVLAGVEASVAAHWTDTCLAAARARGDDTVTGYQAWRSAIMEIAVQA
jgi:enediyne biosynthesis protein E3